MLLLIERFWSRAKRLVTPGIQFKRAQVWEEVSSRRSGALKAAGAGGGTSDESETLHWGSRWTEPPPRIPWMMRDEVYNWPELDMLPVSFCATPVNDGSRPGCPPTDAAAKLLWRKEEEKLLMSQLQDSYLLKRAFACLGSLPLCFSCPRGGRSYQRALRRTYPEKPSDLGQPHTTSPHLPFSGPAFS